MVVIISYFLHILQIDSKKVESDDLTEIYLPIVNSIYI